MSNNRRDRRRGEGDRFDLPASGFRRGKPARVAERVPPRIYHLTHAQSQGERHVRLWARESIYVPNYSR
jgi:hypothetical protein